MRIAFFGLPLAALLIGRDGHQIVLGVLSPVEAPGRRRLARTIGPERLVDAALVSELEAAVDRRLIGLEVDLLVS